MSALRQHQNFVLALDFRRGDPGTRIPQQGPLWQRWIRGDLPPNFRDFDLAHSPEAEYLASDSLRALRSRAAPTREARGAGSVREQIHGREQIDLKQTSGIEAEHTQREILLSQDGEDVPSPFAFAAHGRAGAGMCQLRGSI
jgi:hypothetical protein